MRGDQPGSDAGGKADRVPEHFPGADGYVERLLRRVERRGRRLPIASFPLFALGGAPLFWGVNAGLGQYSGPAVFSAFS